MGRLGKSLALVLFLLTAFSGFLVIYFVPVGKAQSGNAPSNFAISIVASINGYSSTCVFGVNPDSSTIFSPKYDSLAPFQNSGIRIYLLYSNQTVLLTQELSQYIVPSNGSTTWRLGVANNDQRGILTLTWNTTSIASLTLVDNIFGKVYADMNAVSNYSYRTSPDGIANFIIAYKSATAPNPTPTLTSTPTTAHSPTPTPPTNGTSSSPLMTYIITTGTIIILTIIAYLLLLRRHRKSKVSPACISKLIVPALERFVPTVELKSSCPSLPLLRCRDEESNGSFGKSSFNPVNLSCCKILRC